MSYDLNFYKKTIDKVDYKEIVNHLNQLSFFQQTDENQWFYSNEETGVYCSFEYDNSNVEEDLDESDQDNFSTFENIGLAFNINYIRPQFFGIECFPIVDTLSEELGLYIFNPQSGEAPQKYEKGYLEKEWSELNQRYSNLYFKEQGLSFMELNKSNKSWAFNKDRNSLQEKLGDEYFVPRIFYLKAFEEKEAETLSVWPHNIPYVLPEVDYIVIQRKKRKFLRIKEEQGIIKYSKLMGILNEFFENEETYKIIHPREAQRIKTLFNDLPFDFKIEEYGEIIPNDMFVNIIN